MFAQVIQGRVSDRTAFRAAMDRWEEELAPGAIGWLGSTAGITEDGRAIAVVRFESEEAAGRNSRRPEQDRWWAETSKLYEGEARFTDSTDVTMDLHGDPDQAGFVQIIQGHTTDQERARQLMNADSDKWAAFRPDVIGTVVIGHPDGGYTMVAYFTSEEEAREGERKEAPPELRAEMEEMDRLSSGETEFFDLTQPVLRSPN
jgi:hypothetical protein